MIENLPKAQDLREVYAGTSDPLRDEATNCIHCGDPHYGVCHRIKSIEYHDTGNVKRVEYHGP